MAELRTPTVSELLAPQVSNQPDVATLMQGFQEPPKPWSIKDEALNTLKDYGKAVLNPSAVLGEMRAGAEAALAGLQQARATEVARQAEGGFEMYDSGEIQQSANDLRENAKALQTGLDESLKPKSWAGRVGKSITGSVPAMLAGTAAGIIGGPGAGLAVGMSAASGQVYGQKYNERIQMGDSVEDAEKAAILHSLAELGGEALGASAFVKVFQAAKAGAKMTPSLVREAFTEGGEEVITGLVQGSEDAYRGKGKDPAGLAGTLGYFKSGQFLQDAVDNFVGGFAMGGGSMAAIMKPIQMSYRPAAINAARAMDQTIKEAEASGNPTVQFGNSEISIDEVKTKLSDTVEAFGLKPEEYITENNAVVDEQQTLLDSAIVGIRESLQKDPKLEDVVEDTTVDETEINKPVPAVVTDESGNTSVIAEEPVTAQQEFESFISQEPVKTSVRLSKNVPKELGSILEEVQNSIGTKANINIVDISDFDNSPEKSFLENNEHSVDNIALGRVYITPINGKPVYTVVGRFSGKTDVTQFSVGMHEVSGHITDYEHFQNAPSMIKDAINKSFEAWLESAKPEGFISPDLVQSMQDQDIDPAIAMHKIAQGRAGEVGTAARARLFREYKAHQINSALQKRPEVRSIIERHWAKLADKLKALYKRFTDNYSDMTTGVESFDQFVDWLYTGKTPNQVNVENLNGNSGTLRRLQDVIFDSIFDIIDGKRVIKDSWRFKKVYKDGTLGKITRSDIANSGFNYQELKGKTVVRKGESVIFTIPWDSSRGLSKDSARMVATNIRDMFILASLPTRGNSVVPQAAKILNTTSGQRIKMKDPRSASLVQAMWNRAASMAEAEGITERQAFLRILSGEGSAFSGLRPGIAGTELTGSFRKNLDRWIDMHKTDLQEAVDSVATPESENADQIVRDENPGVETQSPVSKNENRYTEVSNATRDLIVKLSQDAKQKIETFDQLVEKVIFYLDIKGKDYSEISAMDRNLVNATIKDMWQTLTGEELSKEINNKIVQQDKVVALKMAGVDTTLDEIELMRMAKDMGMFDELIGDFEKVSKSLGDEKTLATYADPVDNATKAIFSDQDLKWKPNKGGITSIPGSGLVSKTWKAASDDGKLTLDKIIDHRDLFKVYPRLKNLKVKFYKDSSNELGSADWKNWTIYINYTASSTKVTETLLHELQHIIQSEERWAGGFNPESAQFIKSDRASRRVAIRKDIKLFKDIIANLDRGQTIQDAISNVKQANRFNGLNLQSISKLEQLIQKGGIELAQSVLEQEYASIAKETIFDKDSAFNIYLHAAGEEEARRAVALYYLTDEEIRVGYATQGSYFGTDIGDTSLLYKTDSTTGDIHLHTDNLTNEFVSDDLLFASYEALMSDDLVVAQHKRKRNAPKDIKTGPYKDILKSVPQSKVKRVRKIDLARIEKRRQDLIGFLTKMDTIKEVGESRGLSLAEMMLKAGFDSAETRRAIAKYNRHKSRFSQNETIIRLAEVAGLINEETGRTGLESLIKAMFPEQNIDEPQEDGTIKTVVYAGSDGSLQSLSTIAKDILINKIQAIITQGGAAKFDIESEQTLAELRDTYSKEFHGVKGIKSVLRFVKALQASAADFLETTKSGKELSFRLRRFMLQRTLMQRDYLVRLNRYSQIFESPEARFRLYKIITGDEIAMTPDERGFSDLIKSINRVYGKEMELLQVKVYRKNGQFEFFKFNRDMSDAYFPRMWKAEWWRNPTDAMIQSLLDAGEAQDRQHAKRLIQDYQRQRIKADKFYNIEQARETELGGWITDPFEVYTKYILKASNRLATLKEFGATPEVTLAQFAIKHFKESRDPDGLTKTRDLINRVLGTKIEDQLAREYKAGLSYGVMYSVGLLLQHAFMVQPGVVANMGAVGGFRNLVKGLVDILPTLWGNKDGAMNQRWAELAGVLAFTVNRELNDVVMDEETRLKTDKVLRSFGITQIDSAMRIWAAIVGKLYATSEALRYIEKQDAKGYRRLKALGIRPENLLQPGYMQTQEWIARDLRMAALAFTEDTNFVLDPMRTPAIIQGHPLAKMFFLFKNFAFQQHRFIMKLLREDRGKAFKSIVGSLTGGSLILLMRTLLQGDDPEKVLEKDGIVKTVWRALMAGGGVGLFAEAFGNAVLPGGGGQTGMSLDSPVLGLLETAGKGAKSLYNFSTDDYTDQDVNNMYRASVMALQAGILTKAPMSVGVPLNAAIGMARPASERLLAPSVRQQETSIFQ